MKLIESRQNKIAKRVMVSAIYDKTRYAMEQLEDSMNEFIGNLDNSVPDTIRSKAGVMKSYVDGIRGNFDKDNFQECIDKLARLRRLSQEYSKKLMEWINRTFPEYKRNEMRQKYDWWYIDGTHFEECLKQEIEWQKKDDWKLTRNHDGAAEAIVNSIKRLMASWSVGDEESVNLKAYGYPDGFRFTASVWRSADGNRSQIDCKAFDAKANRGASCEPFYSNIKYHDNTIREHAEWMLRHIENKD